MHVCDPAGLTEEGFAGLISFDHISTQAGLPGERGPGLSHPETSPPARHANAPGVKYPPLWSGVKAASGPEWLVLTRDFVEYVLEGSLERSMCWAELKMRL